MRRVDRTELVDYQTYQETRPEYRAEVLTEKEP
ncbi:MAG: hypothetical protein RJA70_237, partial [Pseudomonadota bacterium]